MAQPNAPEMGVRQTFSVIIVGRLGRHAGGRDKGEISVTRILGALLLGACLLPAAASAQSMNGDDLKWVNQCIRDNQGEPGATPAIVRGYCICMNEKMDNNESQSITQWEKSHPAERKACDQQAGWR